MFSSPVVGHLTYNSNSDRSPFLPKITTAVAERLAFAATSTGMSPSSQQSQQQQQRLNEMIVALQTEKNQKNQKLMAQNMAMMMTTTSASSSTTSPGMLLQGGSPYWSANDTNGQGPDSGRVSASSSSSFRPQPQPHQYKSSQLEDHQPRRYMSTTAASFLHSYFLPESQHSQTPVDSRSSSSTRSSSSLTSSNAKKRTSSDYDAMVVSVGDDYKRNKIIIKKGRNRDTDQKKESCSIAKIATPLPDYALLHNACKLFSKNTAVVASALQFEPESAHQEVPVVCLRGDDTSVTGVSSSSNSTTMRGGSPITARSYETYKYAINVALKHDASLEVLKLLADAAPEVLIKPDGPDQACTLEILLAMVSQQHRQQTSIKDPSCIAKDLERIVKLLLLANPLAASGTDRHQNTALHYVARYGGGWIISARTVKIIYRSFPAAARHTNFHGHTPLDVAVRNTFVSEVVLDTLQSLSFMDCEGDAVINMDLIEEGLDHSSTGSQISYESFNRDTFSF